MQCPTCHFEQAETNRSCEACGFIFQKYAEAHPAPGVPSKSEPPGTSAPSERPEAGPDMENKVKTIGPEGEKTAVFGLKPVTLFLGAALVAVYSACGFWNSLSFTDGQKFQGQVIGKTVHADFSHGGTDTYSPQVQITLPDGEKKVTEGSPTSFYWLLPSTGETVEVYYKPDALFYDSRINSFYFLWFWPALWGLAAALLILMGWMAQFKAAGLGTMTLTENRPPD